MAQEEFQIGDVVECIDATGSHVLLAGARYTVAKVPAGGPLKLYGIAGCAYSADRFRLVLRSNDSRLPNDFRLGDEVECIDPTGTCLLVKGARYSVTDVRKAPPEPLRFPGGEAPELRLLGLHGPYSADRFRLVSRREEWTPEHKAELAHEAELARINRRIHLSALVDGIVPIHVCANSHLRGEPLTKRPENPIGHYERRHPRYRWEGPTPWDPWDPEV